MARLHSDLGQRTVYLPNGLARAQGLPCVIYKDAAGTQPANLAEYDSDAPGIPGPAILGAAMEVDDYSSRPAFWDLDDLPVLYITVAGKTAPASPGDWGPLVPVLPDAQPQIDAAVAGATAKANAAQAAAVAAATAASLPRTPGKNLFDPLTAVTDQFWNGVGSGTITLAGYSASPKYPVTPGQTYSISNPRNYEFFNADGSAKLHINNASEGPVTFTVPAGTGYLAFTVTTSKMTATQLELGDPTSYEPFGVLVERQIVNGRTLTDSVSSVTALERLPGISVFRSGDDMLLRTAFDATQDLLIPMDLDGGEEAMFLMANTAQQFVRLVPSVTPDSAVWPVYMTGTNIHSAGDDNTPINNGWSYIAGNHGYQPGASQVTTASAHGKTTADLGSQWSDGTRTYTLLKIVSPTVLLFANPYTVSSGIVTAGGTTPAATLTHVSGATNTTSVPITGGVTGLVQIHPCSYGRTYSVDLDGKQVVDGKNAGQTLTVTETYYTASFKGLVDTARANVGTSVFSILSQVPALVRVSNTFRFTGPQMVTAQRVTALEKFNLDMGVTQQYGLVMPAGGSIKQFMGGIGAVGPLNFNGLANLASMGGNLDVTPASYLNPTVPAMTSTQWAYNSSGQPVYGIAVGILPVADGHPSQRVKNAVARSWFISNAVKKNYPQISQGRLMNVGDSLSGTAYRQYLAPPDTAVEFTVSDGTDSWVVAERINATTEGRVRAPSLLGRRVDPVGVPTIRPLSQRITGEGLTYSSPTAGYGMWRATPEPARTVQMPGAMSSPANWFTLIQSPAQNVPLTNGNGILYLFPQTSEESVPIDQAAIWVMTAGTGVVRVGIYANDAATGQPVTVGALADFGTVDATTTGAKEMTLATPLPMPTAFWIGIAWQGASTTAPTLLFNANGAGAVPMNLGTSSALLNAGRYGYSYTPVAGAFGALGTLGMHQLPIPRVGYRRA